MKSAVVYLDGDPIVICDQKPLKRGAMDLGRRSERQLLDDLNRRVFLWAGRTAGPGRYGDTHFQRYQRESTPVMLRFPMDAVDVRQAELCRYNSGAPRRWNGEPSPRGADTFVPFGRWDGVPSGVVEVTFIGWIALPQSTQWTRDPSKGWRCLGAPE
jgi:hypothetical protein